MFGGWLRERVPRTLAGNFSPRPGRGRGRAGAGAGQCGAGRPLPSPGAAPLSTLRAGVRRRCFPPGRRVLGDQGFSVFAPGTVTSSLIHGGS